MRLLIVFILIYSGFFNAYAQLSKTHYIPPITYGEGETIGEQYLYISTPSITDVDITITYGGTQTTTVINRNSHLEFDTSISNYLLEDRDQSRSNKGYIIEASSPVFVSARIDVGPQATSIVSKGVSAKGTTFRTGGFTNLKNFSPGTDSDKFLTFLSVMATEDNTSVNFNEIDNAVEFESNTHQNNVILNKGESYLVTVKSYKPGNSVNRDALLGALVNADKPVVVNCGSLSGSSDDQNLVSTARDAGIDQIVPIERVGKEYLFIRADGNDNNERPLIVAHEDNTEVFLNGATSPNRILNAGEYWSIPGSNFSSSSQGSHIYISTNKKVFAYQSIGQGNNSRNIELFFVPPINDDTPCSVDYIPQASQIGSQSFNGGNVVIVSESGSNVRLNGIDLGVGTPVSGTNFVNYIKPIPSDDEISVTSDSQVYVYYYASSGAATYGGYYSGFTADSQVGFQDVSSNVTCEGGTLELQNVGEYADFYDTYQWFYDDNLDDTINPIPLSANPLPLDASSDTSITATNVGYYFVKVEASSSSGCNQSFESNKFPVASCPDDFDGDSVIDNIDQDFDNDGILNITESTLLDLDVSGFSLNQENNASPTAVISNSSEQLTFDVADDGDSETLGSAAAKFSITGSNRTLLVDNFQNYDAGDIIHIKVPNNQLVSVYDPDGQLQFDFNYDGKYEETELSVTSFDVRFRININASIPPTFSIRSIELDTIAITYLYAGTGTNKITLSFSELYGFDDLDGDGVINVFDLDTDNDGIYDVIESGNSILDTDGDGRINDVSSNDTDSNGRYDAAINPVNTDGVDVPDYLDTDSDGDTISDLIEGGNYLLDANFDGVIDAPIIDSNNDGYHDAANSVPLNSDFNNDSTDKIPDNPDDGKPDYIDDDSDDDDCDDKFESGLPAAATAFNHPDDINTNGIFDFQEYVALLPKDLPVEISACENGTYTLKLELKVTSYNYDDIVWQNSTDNGLNWNNLLDSTFYSGTTTNELVLKNIPLTSSNYLFRAVLSRKDYACWPTESTSTKLKVNPLPQVSSSWSGELIQCDNDTDGVSIFNLLEVILELSVNYANEDFEFYTDINDLSSLIPNPETFKNTPNQTIYVRIISDQGCYIDEPIVLRAVNNDLPVSVLDQDYKECYDYNDGITSFNFSNALDSSGNSIPISDYITDAINIVNSDTVNRTVSFYETYNDALSELNAIPDISNYEISGYPDGGFVKLWVRVDDEFNSCNGIKELITLEVLPDISFEIDSGVLNPINTTDKEVLICNSGTETVSLNLGTTNNKTKLIYEWTLADNTIQTTVDPELEVSEEGNYKIKVKYEDCELSENFKVSIYNINDPQLDFFDLVSGTKRNAIQLKDPNDESAFGLNNYKFLLMDEAGNAISNELPEYQELCVFEDLTGGFYTLIVKDEAECDEKSIEIPIVYFPSFITPNGDGYNDTWEVKGIYLDDYNLDLTKLYVFNRYGKLLGSISLDQSWDGTFNGSPLEATDYWYKVDLVKKSGEVLQPIRGHFSLLK